MQLERKVSFLKWPDHCPYKGVEKWASVWPVALCPPGVSASIGTYWPDVLHVQRSSAVLMIFLTTLTVEMMHCDSSLQNTWGLQTAPIKTFGEQVPPARSRRYSRERRKESWENQQPAEASALCPGLWAAGAPLSAALLILGICSLFW